MMIPAMRITAVLIALVLTACAAQPGDSGSPDGSTVNPDAAGFVDGGSCPTLPTTLHCGPQHLKCSTPAWVRPSNGVAPCSVVDCTGAAKGQWPISSCR